MEILRGFGFEPVLFTAQIVNFLLLFVVFKKFLYKPILKVLDDRAEKIKKGVQEAEKARVLLENAQQEKTNLLKKATEETEKMLYETKKAAAELREFMTQDAKNQADRILKDAKNQADEEMKKMQKVLATMSLSLSEKVLKNIITTLFTREEQEKILQRALVSLRKNKASLNG